MALSEEASEDNIFQLLKAANPTELEQRQQAINEKIHRTFQLSQQRLAELIDQSSTSPTTVSSITVLGAPNTRHGFLQKIVNPLLSANRDRPYTQSELIHEVAKTADKLRKFGNGYAQCEVGLEADFNVQESIMNPFQCTWTNLPRPTLQPHRLMSPYITR